MRPRLLVPLAAGLAAAAASAAFGADRPAASATPSSASGADRPAATAMAEQGTLKVVSRALLDARGGELMGTWLDARRPCSARRTLRISYLVDHVASGRTTRRRALRTGAVENCAEGGPSFGFAVSARGLGMACSNGRWRPGRYAITVRTLDRASGLRASASLYYQETRRC